ncbi:MAG: hypothetical protein WBN51_06535, partial [Gammaproteobacteria bacterium]
QLGDDLTPFLAIGIPLIACYSTKNPGRMWIGWNLWARSDFEPFRRRQRLSNYHFHFGDTPEARLTANERKQSRRHSNFPQ